MGQQLLAAIYRPEEFLTLPQKKKKKWKFSIRSHRSFYIRRHDSQHNCSQLVASGQTSYSHQLGRVFHYFFMQLHTAWLRVTYVSQRHNLLIFFNLNLELNVVLSFILCSCLAWDINLRFNMTPRRKRGSYPNQAGEFIAMPAKALSLFGLPENRDLAVKWTLVVGLAHSEMISVKAFYTWHKWVQSAQFNLLLFSSVVMLNHKQAERGLTNSQWRIKSKNSDLNSRRILFPGELAELLELPGQRLRCCGLSRWESRPLIVHRSHWQEEQRNDEWGINREQGGMLSWDGSHLPFRVFKKRSRARWVSPQRPTGHPKERRKKKTSRKPNSFFFLGSLLRDRHFLHVLNWPCRAVSSTGLLGADCFHTGQCSVPVLVSRKIRVCFLWHWSLWY